jgi:hypothetical protein
LNLTSHELEVLRDTVKPDVVDAKFDVSLLRNDLSHKTIRSDHRDISNRQAFLRQNKRYNATFQTNEALLRHEDPSSGHSIPSYMYLISFPSLEQ